MWHGSPDLQRLSKDELIELVISFTTGQNVSDFVEASVHRQKEKRENSVWRGEAGHEPHNRRLADNPDDFRDTDQLIASYAAGLCRPTPTGIDRRI